MCRIASFAGNKPAAPFLTEALKRLEYRVYDSWGYVVCDTDGEPVVSLGPGAYSQSIVEDDGLPPGNYGIANTRWATHEEATFRNTHPISGGEPGDVTCYVVHNGVIENHAELRKELEREGYVFRTDTDTEVVAHLFDLETRNVEAGFASRCTSLDDGEVCVLSTDSPPVFYRKDGATSGYYHTYYSEHTPTSPTTGLRICFDVDGVICNPIKRDGSPCPYNEREPYKEAVERIRHLRELGVTVVLHTARYMGRYYGDQELARRRGYEELVGWLCKHNIPWDELYFGKPSSDVYVDDRGCRVESAKGSIDWDNQFESALAVLRTKKDA